MKNKDQISFSLDVILVEDPEIGGFTAFFKQFPNILSEGKTQNEAIRKLLHTLHDVFKYKSESSDFSVDSSFKVTNKSVEFCSTDYR